MTVIERLLAFLDDVERVLLAVVARVGPWLSPVAPAYAVYRVAVRRLDYPPGVAVIMGLAIEVAGVSAFHATLRAWSWNREKPVSASQAPTWLGVVLVVVYLVVGIGLAVLVEIVPWLALIAPGSFFILAGVGYTVLAMMVDQSRREAMVKAAREERKAVRAANRKALREASEEGRSNKRGKQGDSELDTLLSVVRERAGVDPFGVGEAAAWLSRQRTATYRVLRYGLARGVVRQVGRGSYRIANGE